MRNNQIAISVVFRQIVKSKMLRVRVLVHLFVSSLRASVFYAEAPTRLSHITFCLFIILPATQLDPHQTVKPTRHASAGLSAFTPHQQPRPQPPPQGPPTSLAPSVPAFLAAAMDPPAPASVDRAVQALVRLRAVADSPDNDARGPLTDGLVSLFIRIGFPRFFLRGFLVFMIFNL